MSQMDYFRRPILIGNALKRTSNAVVRGSVRRNDADGSYNAPYFPGVTVNQTLLITTQAGSYTATFATVVAAGLDYQQAITTINAAITGATATDLDGAISISSTTAGATGLVSVTGGTAATVLGFDVTLGAITATGGDIASTPEGRLQNPFGTAFPIKGENLTSDMLTRGMGRMAANLDVLYADLAREDAFLQKIGSITGSADGKSVALAGGTKVFNGYGPSPILTRLSTPEEIAPFFVLIDPTTKRVLPNRVVGVVASAYTTGEPPYTDAANPTDAGKNILGLNLTKLASTAITAIKNGRQVTCTGAGTASSVGDIASIASATNTSPWSNNGTKWIVESIIDANNIVLRPASKVELTQLGVSLTEIQPILELNSTLGGGAYGNLTVFTGMYSSGVTLVIRPILGVSQSVEVWVAQAASARTTPIGTRMRALHPFANNQYAFRANSDADIPLKVQRYSSTGSGDLLEALDETGAVLTKVTSSGKIVATTSAANTDALLSTGTGTGAGASLVGGATGPAIIATPGGGGSPATGSVRLTTQVAPSAPTNGELWFEGALYKARTGGSTFPFILGQAANYTEAFTSATFPPVTPLGVWSAPSATFPSDFAYVRTTTSTVFSLGKAANRSGSQTASTNSSLGLVYYLTCPSRISFHFDVLCNNSFGDKLQCFIDGVKVMEESTTVNTTYEFGRFLSDVLREGLHTFDWRFVRGASGSVANEKAEIGNIAFIPETAWQDRANRVLIEDEFFFAGTALTTGGMWGTTFGVNNGTFSQGSTAQGNGLISVNSAAVTANDWMALQLNSPAFGTNFGGGSGSPIMEANVYLPSTTAMFAEIGIWDGTLNNRVAMVYDSLVGTDWRLTSVSAGTATVVPTGIVPAGIFGDRITILGGAGEVCWSAMIGGKMLPGGGAGANAMTVHTNYNNTVGWPYARVGPRTGAAAKSIIVDYIRASYLRNQSSQIPVLWAY